MPNTQQERRIKSQVNRRGGAKRIRSESLPGGKYRRIYVVAKAGPEGGHTIAGPISEKKRNRR